MRYAITDIGSNTIKVHFFEADKPNRIRKINSITYPAKLIGYIENGTMNEAGITLLCTVLTSFLTESERLCCDRFCAFATASLRRADNASRIIERVKAETGIEIDLVSGEREAELSMRGVQQETGLTSHGIQLDIGGGSTEVITFSKEKITSLHSMPFGSLSLFRDYVSGKFPNMEEAELIRSAVSKAYLEAGQPSTDRLLITGGTGRAICTVIAYLDQADTSGICTVTADRLYRLEESLIHDSRTPQMLETLITDRATTLLPGLIAICKILQDAYSSTAVFVTAGVREGYLLSIL